MAVKEVLHVPELLLIDNKTTVVQFNVVEIFGSKSQYIFFNIEAFKDPDMTV